METTTFTWAIWPTQNRVSQECEVYDLPGVNFRKSLIALLTKIPRTMDEGYKNCETKTKTT